MTNKPSSQMDRNFVCPRCRGTISLKNDGSLPLCPSCGQTLNLEDIESGKLATLPHVVEDYRLQKIGPYIIEELLGSGGMGCVFKARHQKNENCVAIKFLYRQFARQKDFIFQFQKEAKALSKLDHPNIVHIVAEGHFQETYYYIMEYVDGVSLADELLKGAMDEDRVNEIALEIVSALDHAHSIGITHRDLKPENIFITDSGVKILDFGIAHLAYDIPNFHTLTISNDMIGTFVYMSPEQKLGRTVDARSDLYSLGIVLYQMLTGEVPLGVFEVPTSLKQGLNKKWDIIISRLLQRDPEKRYRSSEELLLAIKGEKREIPRIRKPFNWYTWAILFLIVIFTAAYLYRSEINKLFTRKPKTLNTHFSSNIPAHPPSLELKKEEEKPKEYLVPKATVLRFWTEPTKKSKMIMQLKSRDLMLVIEKVEGESDGKTTPWFKVSFKDKEGFVEADWVKSVSEEEVRKMEEESLKKNEPSKNQPDAKKLPRKPVEKRQRTDFGFMP
ncbi:MAG: protein kinase [Candidatus Coatesbacteria bacterium]|nr:protein kinase [Candidatus Coatesbacteria bacterium]